MRKRTEFGTVVMQDNGAFYITSNQSQRYNWAHRPGEWWPCSELAQQKGYVRVWFDRRGDLVDLQPYSMDCPSDELGAWASDVIDLATGGDK